MLPHGNLVSTACAIWQPWFRENGGRKRRLFVKRSRRAVYTHATSRPLAKAQTESKKGNNCSVAQTPGGPHIHRQTLEPLVETKESANERSIFRFSVDSEERNSLGYRKHPWRDGWRRKRKQDRNNLEYLCFFKVKRDRLGVTSMQVFMYAAASILHKNGIFTNFTSLGGGARQVRR